MLKHKRFGAELACMRLGFLKSLTALALTIGLAGTTGCIFSSSESASSGAITIGISNGGQALAAPSFAGAISSVTITSAKVVIGRIKFKSTSGGDSADFRSDTPLIVDLSVDTAIQNLGTISVPVGVYDETRFRIARLDPSDSAVYNDNPLLRDISIRVEGFVDGMADSAFVWTASFNEEQVHRFTPVTVGAGETVNLVFEFDTKRWFDDGAGGQLDPRDALTTGSVQSDIENNIKAAFKVIQR